MATKGGKITVRRWTIDDIPGLVECHYAVYREFKPETLYNARTLEMQLNAFPEGQALAEVDGVVVGYATSLIVQLDDENQIYNFNELTGSGTFSSHNPGGDTLYGADIGVHPDYRGRGVSKKLYAFRKRLLSRYNLRRLVAYGRIPGYGAVQGKMTAEDYVNRVKRGELRDSSLNAHLSAGYEVKRVLLDLMKDQPSADYSTWIEMPNPRYRPERRKLASAPLSKPVRTIRVCSAQYFMRRLSSWDEFERCVDFFVDAADTYHCHYLLFPELFTANLFSLMPSDIDSVRAARELAGMHHKYVEMFRQRAEKHQMFIIGGSHPTERDGLIYNTAHLFTPSGNVYTQDKLHVTPAERRWFGLEPGDDVNVFETPHGRIAIQICYDVEFPEMSRLLALSGVDVIFVPFSTDDRKAYYRVRYTAQARAVENYLYVVMAGNVGNLPQVRSYLINYGRAAVLTPSDVGFPMHAVLAESEPNQEAVLMADLDLGALQGYRTLASVRPLHDRRLDLYNIDVRRKFNIIRVE